jgi:hypothetical protein
VNAVLNSSARSLPWRSRLGLWCLDSDGLNSPGFRTTQADGGGLQMLRGGSEPESDAEVGTCLPAPNIPWRFVLPGGRAVTIVTEKIAVHRVRVPSASAF